MNLATLMVAGYDTTSTGLSYSMYVLAKNPEERVKLQDEIDAKFDRENLVVSCDEYQAINSNAGSCQDSFLVFKVDYDAVMDLPYLDMFIKEVLRMYPFGNK